MPRALKSLRWTLELAASEFGFDRKTITSGMKAKGILPGADKKFSTADICRAVFSDGEAARTALAVSKKIMVELQIAKLADTLVYRDQVATLWDNAIIALRQKISDLGDLSDAQKRDLLKDLQTIPIDDYVSKNSASPGEDAAGELVTA